MGSEMCIRDRLEGKREVKAYFPAKAIPMKRAMMHMRRAEDCILSDLCGFWVSKVIGFVRFELRVRWSSRSGCACG